MSLRLAIRNRVRDLIRPHNRFQLIDFRSYFHERDAAFLERCLPSPHRVTLDDPAFTGRATPRPDTEAGLFWNILWRCAFEGAHLEPVHKDVEYCSGDKCFRMRLDLTKAPECGYYLRDPTPQLTRLLERGGRTMLDIGSNAGFHALSAGLFFKRVVAFEPTPATFARLARNVELSGIEHVTPHRLALSDRSGSLHFLESQTHTGSNKIVAGATESTIDVPAETLDDFVAREGLDDIDFVKIDVEGHEVSVVRGGQKTLGAQQPDLFVELYNERRAAEFIGLLPDAYRVFDPVEEQEVPRAGAAALASRIKDYLFAARDPFAK